MIDRKKKLKGKIIEIFGDLIGESLADFFATILIEYPATSSHHLPYTLIHEFNISKGSIEEKLEELVKHEVFEIEQRGWKSRIKVPVTYEDYTEYLREWLKINGDKKKISEFEKIREKLKKWLKNYKKMRAEDYATIIPIASSRRGEESYIGDLDPKSATEILIPALSLETQRDIIEEKVKEGVRRGTPFRFLLLDPELGQDMERSRAKEEINEGISFLERLKDWTEKKPGSLKYRLVEDEEYAYFLGLLRRSSNPEKNIYRIILRRPGKERGDVSPILRGKYKTTLFKILEKYFEDAWKSGRKPGIKGFFEKNLKKPLLILPFLALFLWSVDLISPHTLTILLAFLIPVSLDVVYEILK
ncbi:hypothetical protein AKJ57_00965 [candidate division MSBL1 archaeon SCGC-AAA259A05]|uniref:Uncharacterized protein n=1 Tax=candidate division MSBL1 archaeon SCGC-AAA259A05 TaxID=1698259 RepID=A0A133UBC2_9EURY|nr:hypothetical protein AKJ57_00965 [candidate division MSBL1 archaeon SCGC-AAA259A05]